MVGNKLTVKGLLACIVPGLVTASISTLIFLLVAGVL